MEPIEKIKEAFSKIRGHPEINVVGYQLFYVGGSVRDEIMGNPSHDVDLATNATPAGIITTCKVFGLDFRYTKNSVAHGTIVVEGIEITTLRKDVSCDGRNATVEWATTIQEDLSRRDLTINAVAKNVYTGEIVDPFFGVQDIEYGIIRAVGNPVDRLNEDTLRALRAVRFANRFGFDIERNLLKAIWETDISNLSIERVREEFMKILATRNDRYTIIILNKVLPEFSVLYNLDGGNKHAETVDIHSLLAMRYMMKGSDKPLLIFATLLHDIGKFYTKDDPERMFKGHEDIGAEKVKEIMTRMKFSNDEIDYVQIIIKNHMRWHFY
jgi:tRNA nucleotidyltransferase (CCA-adding enzyme)